MVPASQYDNEIEFESAQFIDSCDSTKNYEFKLPRYRLRYNWIQSEMSIVSIYCFIVEMEPNGRLISPIELGNGNVSSSDFDFLTIEEFRLIYKSMAPKSGYG